MRRWVAASRLLRGAVEAWVVGGGGHGGWRVPQWEVEAWYMEGEAKPKASATVCAESARRLETWGRGKIPGHAQCGSRPAPRTSLVPTMAHATAARRITVVLFHD